MIEAKFEYQDKEDTDGPSFWWINPWDGRREKVANLWWPGHPVEATAEVEALFESFAIVVKGAREKAVLAWAVATFGSYANKPEERARRLLEEAVELAQALGVPKEGAAKILDRAYERPAGDPAKEIAQVGMTLEALAAVLSVDLSAAIDGEFARVRSKPKEHWGRARGGEARRRDGGRRMSRSGYVDDEGGWSLVMWRGAVASAIRGRRGQAFLREMLAALDALPAKRLVANELEASGDVCAIGAVGRARGVDMTNLDPEDRSSVAGTFGIAEAMAAEIVFENDEAGAYKETPEDRFDRVRRWIASQLKDT